MIIAIKRWSRRRRRLKGPSIRIHRHKYLEARIRSNSVKMSSPRLKTTKKFRLCSLGI